MNTRLRRTCLLLGLLGLAGCAAYHVGNQSLYPTGIETVYVPVFQSASFRRNMGERLTEAVIKQIELRTPYKVVDTPNADSTLRGQIISDTRRLTVSANTGEARESDLAIAVQVSWIDRCGRLLRDGQPIPVDAAVLVTGASRLVPEVGQSMATQQQIAIVRVAEQIVSMMEAPW
jgi:hypothetical protein